MTSTRWLGCADPEVRDEVVAALKLAGYEGAVEFVDSPQLLRSAVALSDQDHANVVVGRLTGGVSDINLAAAIVQDRQANQVVLVRDKASGSLRSRARRAGITAVIDSSEVAFGLEEDVDDILADGGLVEPTSPPKPQTHVGAASIASHPERVRADGAPVLCLCSGRGGSGKTAIAVAAASIAASWGMRVGFVDLDLSCGNAYSYLGLPSGCDLSTAGGNDSSFTLPHGVTVSDRMRIWGPCDRPEMSELAMPMAYDIVSAAARECDLVLVDTSTTFTDAVAQAAQMCDRLLLVSDDRPTSLSSLSRMAGLAVRLGVARTRIVRVANRCDPRAKTDLSIGRAEVGLEAARIFRVFECDELPELLSLGQGHSLSELEAEFTESVAHLLAQLLSEMGRLPNCQAALQAMKVDGTRQGWGIFGRRREVS